MSEHLLTAEGMTISAYAGPARADGGPRRRIQIYTCDGTSNELISLSDEQWGELEIYFAKRRHPARSARPVPNPVV